MIYLIEKSFITITKKLICNTLYFCPERNWIILTRMILDNDYRLL